MKALFWLLFLPLVALATVFAVNNRGAVMLGLEPLPYTVSLPVYMVVLFAALAGFLVGSALVWLAQGKWRRMARRNTRQMNALERDISSQCEEAARRDATIAEAVSPVSGGEIVKRK